MVITSQSESSHAIEMQEAGDLSMVSESRMDSDTVALEKAGKIPVLKVWPCLYREFRGLIRYDQAKVHLLLDVRLQLSGLGYMAGVLDVR